MTKPDESALSLANAVNSLGVEMGLPSNFLTNLRKEDDWSFAIKSTAYIEAVLSHAIIQAWPDDRIGRYVEKLPLHEKIKLAESLDLIDPDAQAFLSRLSSARNRAAHNLKSFDFEYRFFIEALPAQERDKAIKDLAFFVCAEDRKQKKDSVKQLIMQDPRQSIWYGLLHFSGLTWWRCNASQSTHTRAVLDKVKRSIQATVSEASPPPAGARDHAGGVA